MVKLKTSKIVKKICDTCHGNGYVRVATGDTAIDLEITVRCISAGTAIQRESFMKRLMLILSMTVILTNCTKLEFDGFDPATTALRWVITHEGR
tara:strand:+ start:318 stop:599 length:282 start_codon:yes stop_codon:yes gene_type:complete